MTDRAGLGAAALARDALVSLIDGLQKSQDWFFVATITVNATGGIAGAPTKANPGNARLAFASKLTLRGTRVRKTDFFRDPPHVGVLRDIQSIRRQPWACSSSIFGRNFPQ